MKPTVLVFGGSRGIGLAISKLLAKDSYKVAIASRNETNINCALNEISVAGTIGIKCDVVSEDEIQTAMENVEKKLGPPNIVINAVGINEDSLLIRTSKETIRKIIDVNLIGGLLVSKVACRTFIKSKQPESCIVLIGSVVGLRGNIGQCVYSASKSGLMGFTKSLAKEMAPKNIRVNLLVPGFIDTDMTKKLAAREQLMSSVPMGRFGSANEVAYAVQFLTKAKYITGQVIPVDGGLNLVL